MAATLVPYLNGCIKHTSSYPLQGSKLWLQFKLFQSCYLNKQHFQALSPHILCCCSVSSLFPLHQQKKHNLIQNIDYLLCYSSLNSAWSFCISQTPPTIPDNTPHFLLLQVSMSFYEPCFSFGKCLSFNIHFEFVSLEPWSYNFTQMKLSKICIFV